MSEPIIKVHELGKKYRIGAKVDPKGEANFRDAILNAVKAPFRNLNRLRKLTNFEDENNGVSDDIIWALKDVSFEVNKGDVVGIIGRNGSGKSTLLKILSRITEPTKGCIELRGRTSSLLEVGTGFHRDLTGRENIYLNGSILGMKKWEIDKKFDEIVAFSEIEKFLDTPVKHYSSGMYVRLAFAVAAHLEPEILIVDEVLAVGDAAFQKKCLGKMGDIAKGGRTVLFVSHNMGAIRALCNRAVLLKNGNLVMNSNVDNTTSNYLSEGNTTDSMVEWSVHNAPQSPEIRFRKAYMFDDQGKYASLLDNRKEFSIVVEYDVLKPLKQLRIGFLVQTLDGIPVCGSNDPVAWTMPIREPGHYISQCVFPGYVLNAGMYSIFFGADMPPYNRALVTTSCCLNFTIEDVDGHGPLNEKLPGIVRPKLDWNVRQMIGK